MAAAEPKRRRCAIYTRKSSEEGLEQDFNSLDAQREAGEAYIQSQKSEGWTLVSTHYDDGGFSGGNLERPALKKLLADIEAGKVDTVVVYKVDRLTRSLADFAKIVEVLDAHSVSFVSITQQFNTTTSMGRLTLNMLLSFAQFEREVTGERIRDKLAASKRKGLWMGGYVPLGYRPKGRTLEIIESEAKTVRTLFRLYLELGNVRQVKEEVDRRGLRSKRRRGKVEQTKGGHVISTGAIYHILNNPIYIGRIRHKSESHAGQHPAIIDQETWDRTRKQLAVQAPGKSRFKRTANHHPLVGKLIDEDGVSLTPTSTSTTRSGRRHRYYVSRSTLYKQPKSAPSRPTTKWRLPAHEIQTTIGNAVRSLLANPLQLSRLAGKAKMREKLIADLLESARNFEGDLLRLVKRVDLAESQLTIHLALSELKKELDSVLQHSIPFSMRRRGNEARLIIADQGIWAMDSRVDPVLVRVIARARRWFEDLSTGRAGSILEIASAEGVSAQFIGNVIPLAFLSPDILKGITAGNQPEGMMTDALIKRIDIPKSWTDQKSAV